MNDEAKLRRCQEEIAQMIESGTWKEVVRFQKLIYDEYRRAGFSEAQSIELVKGWMQRKE